MIRQGQAELQAIRDQAAPGAYIDHPDSEDLTPPAERSGAATNGVRHQSSNSNSSLPPTRGGSPIIRSSLELSPPPSQRSQVPSRAASPALRNTSAGTFGPSADLFSLGGRQTLIDENAYYQAETQNLTRENQMLRQRVRELGMYFNFSCRRP